MGWFPPWKRLSHHAVFNEIKIFEQILRHIFFPFRELQAPMEESEDTRRTWRLLRNNAFTVDFVWLKPGRDPEKFLPASRRHDVEAPQFNKENRS